MVYVPRVQCYIGQLLCKDEALSKLAGVKLSPQDSGFLGTHAGESCSLTP